MTVAYFLVALSIAALATLLLLARGQWYAKQDQPAGMAELQAIDVEAFRNLVDEQEVAYLRESLPWTEFRRVHRERMLAAIEYVWAAFGNAGILVSIAEAARESADPQVVAAAERLFDNATHLRWYAIQVIPRLYLSMLFPGTGHSPRNLFDRYDAVTRQALVLGGLAAAGRNL